MDWEEGLKIWRGFELWKVFLLRLFFGVFLLSTFERAFEVANALSKSLSQLWKPTGAEDHNHNQKDDD